MRRKLGNIAAVVAVPALAVALFAGAAQASSVTTVDAVRHQLVMLPYYSIFDNLAYRVDGNSVILYGQVTRPTLKTDAERVVKHVEGVERVVNNIEVLPLSPFDNQIRRAEYRAIFGFAGLYRYAMGANPSIHIIVDNGHVTLEGVVGNQGDKNLANIRANGVAGVFSVTNHLQVSNRS